MHDRTFFSSTIVAAVSVGIQVLALPFGSSAWVVQRIPSRSFVKHGIVSPPRLGDRLDAKQVDGLVSLSGIHPTAMYAVANDDAFASSQRKVFWDWFGNTTCATLHFRFNDFELVGALAVVDKNKPLLPSGSASLECSDIGSLSSGIGQEVFDAQDKLEDLQTDLSTNPFTTALASPAADACVAAISPFYAFVPTLPNVNNARVVAGILAAQFEVIALQFESNVDSNDETAAVPNIQIMLDQIEALIMLEDATVM